jgi:oligoendopeptidase F
MLTKESRLFMTYNETLGDVLTLAHESGHAFHNHVMRNLRPFARSYPMTLAETASTFSELIMLEGAVNDPSLSEALKALFLDLEIGHAAVYLLDIPVRYEFERALYEERGSGEVSVSRLKALMVESQRRVLGDVLAEGGEDAYFWASKLHFYITGTTFYNFPYTFGYLLSRGFFSLFSNEGSSFLPKYERFLGLAGSDTVEGVVRQSIGCDLQSRDFWQEAIGSLEEPLNRFERLLPKIKALTLAL